MNIRIEAKEGVKLIRPEGQIAGEDEELERLVKAITDQLGAAGGRMVIDLSLVPYVNSSGLAALVRIVSQANVQENRVVLAAATKAVAGLFEITRLNRYFEVAGTVDEALGRLRT